MNRRIALVTLGVAAAAGLTVALAAPAAPASATWWPHPVVPSHTYNPSNPAPSSSSQPVTPGPSGVVGSNAVTPAPSTSATPVVTATMTTPPPAAQPVTVQGCR
jgi:hypothetical protein